MSTHTCIKHFVSGCTVNKKVNGQNEIYIPNSSYNSKHNVVFDLYNCHRTNEKMVCVPVFWRIDNRLFLDDIFICKRNY